MKSIHKHIKNEIGSFRTGLIACIFSALSSCEDFVDTPAPTTEVVSETVYSSDETAIAAIRGVYIQMMSGVLASGTFGSVTHLAGFSSDEFLDFSGNSDRVEFNRNALTSSNGDVARLWKEAYTLIYYANSALEGLENSNGLSSAIKDQLEGEARFIRAFCFFYLVNLYGNVPLILSTDYKTNNAATQIPTSDAYLQIKIDLQQAQLLLSENYEFSNGERVQPNQSAATALLSRVYLYSKDWSAAETEATKVIDNTPLYRLENELDNVFLANSKEAIWQLKPVRPGRNTREAEAFINVGSPNSQTLTDELVRSFDLEDQRRSSWVDSIIFNGVTHYHPFKYKVRKTNQPLTEYSMVLRLAEQYLIRSEARAQQNNITGAQSDLNMIRARAGLPNTAASDQASILLAIEQERRLELFTEWGHRWLDLSRTGRSQAVLSPFLLKDWQAMDVLYPIPQAEREVNSNLSQNEGY